MTDFTRRTAAAVAFVSLFGATTSAFAQPVRIIERVMPAPRVEIVPAPPRPGMNWVRGHWMWRRGGWVWVRGHFVGGAVPPMPPLIVETRPPAPGARGFFWVPGHYAWEGMRWRWHPGVWARR